MFFLMWARGWWSVASSGQARQPGNALLWEVNYVEPV